MTANRRTAAADGHGKDDHGVGASELPGSRSSAKIERRPRPSRGWPSMWTGGRAAAVRHGGGGGRSGRARGRREKRRSICVVVFVIKSLDFCKIADRSLSCLERPIRDGRPGSRYCTTVAGHSNAGTVIGAVKQ